MKHGLVKIWNFRLDVTEGRSDLTMSENGRYFRMLPSIQLIGQLIACLGNFGIRRVKLRAALSHNVKCGCGQNGTVTQPAVSADTP